MSRVRMVTVCLLLASGGCKARSTVATLRADETGGAVTFTQRLGLTLGPADGGGVSVTDVKKVSPACVMGLRGGDRIVAVNGTAVNDPSGFASVTDLSLKTTFQPWCFKVMRADGSPAVFLPSGCDDPAGLDANSARRQYVCDPSHLVFCGPLSAECMDPSAVAAAAN